MGDKAIYKQDEFPNCRRYSQNFINESIVPTIAIRDFGTIVHFRPAGYPR